MRDTITISGGDSAAATAAREATEKEVQELSKRFEILHLHFRDLEVFCDSFVPRKEVEDAMQAIFKEVKNMRATGVTMQMLKDSLKLKADADEFKRYMSLHVLFHSTHKLTDLSCHCLGLSAISAGKAKPVPCTLDVSCAINLSHHYLVFLIRQDSEIQIKLGTIRLMMPLMTRVHTQRLHCCPLRLSTGLRVLIRPCLSRKK